MVQTGYRGRNERGRGRTALVQIVRQLNARWVKGLAALLSTSFTTGLVIGHGGRTRKADPMARISRPACSTAVLKRPPPGAVAHQSDKHARISCACHSALRTSIDLAAAATRRHSICQSLPGLPVLPPAQRCVNRSLYQKFNSISKTECGRRLWLSATLPNHHAFHMAGWLAARWPRSRL
jgi:hypothetical protein